VLGHLHISAGFHDVQSNVILAAFWNWKAVNFLDTIPEAFASETGTRKNEALKFVAGR
jgi:hypothetical protein